MQEENFVIRIYRSRKLANAARGYGVALTGIVEAIANGERASFQSAEELWAILGGDQERCSAEVNLDRKEQA